MLTLLLAAPFAHAFCGTYVGPVGSSIENHLSQVVVARDGTQTTLTVASDVVGDTSSFALVIPLPEVIDAADVALADPDVFTLLDAYSAPRIVSYTCDDFYADTADSSDSGGSEGGSADGVTVESHFSVGAYDIFVLSAQGSEGLLAWFEANGFTLPEASAPVLQEYIDANQYFLAARVDLTSDPSVAAYLAPLTFRYTSEAWSLPIRIGTTVSPGVQDLVVYALSDGRAAISNYPEAPVEDDCMLPDTVTDYGAFYEGQLDAAFTSGIWLTEYAWSPSGCDPCSSPPLDPATLEALGGSKSGFVTRLRLRYTPEQATQDLMLYDSASGYDQVRYIEYRYELESLFPVCGVGMIPDGGECDDGGGDSGGNDTADTAGGDTADGKTLQGGCACGVGTPGPGGAILAFAAALVVSRRRR